jgi:hypothetical protein
MLRIYVQPCSGTEPRDVLVACREAALLGAGRIFQAVKGPQESEMGLEVRHIDQRGHFMVANGKVVGSSVGYSV